MSNTIRSFLAFDIEDPGVIKRLLSIQSKLMHTGATLKLIKAQNIHLTIKFLGDIYPSMIDAIYQKMKQISFSPFNIELAGLGAFPKLSYPRIIWVGIKKGKNELIDIFNQLELNLSELGFKPELKGFNPHLTIARVRSSRNKSHLIQVIKEFEAHEFGVENIQYLRLKKSDLTPKGPIYSNLREVSSREIYE